MRGRIRGYAVRLIAGFAVSALCGGSAWIGAGVAVAAPAPPLAHAELGDRSGLEVSAGGLRVRVTVAPTRRCAVPTLLGDQAAAPPAPCKMAILSIEDSGARGAAARFTAPLSPYGDEASGLSDLQIDLRRLDAASRVPQVVASVYTGGAHCCAITSIIGRDAQGRWTATSPDELGGEDRPGFADADGDGVPEIITQDGRFLYLFASHAGSYTPDVIWRYHAGRLSDITTDPAVRPWLEGSLKRSEHFWIQQGKSEPNGFMADYVAMKARMGEFSQGWSWMLSRYDHHPDKAFLPTLCDLKKGNPKTCSGAEKRPAPFPEVLASFLLSAGYVSEAQVASVMAPSSSTPDSSALAASETAASGQYRPDFSCSPPPERNGVAAMLCRDSEAAKHELEFDQVYYALRQRVGPDGWDALKREVIADQNAMNMQCGLPVPGVADQTVPADGASCYIAGMDGLAEKYRGRLSGAALEESRRPLDEHIALQQKLIDGGWLPAGSVADGVYGEATRDAIAAWQRVAKRPDASTFLSDDDAAALLRTPAAGVAGGTTGGTAGAVQGAGSAAGQSGVAPGSAGPVSPAAPAVQGRYKGLTILGLPPVFTVLISIVGLVVYFVPFGVACVRDTMRKPAVFAVNLLLGWTVLGWIAALVMAASYERRRKAGF